MPLEGREGGPEGGEGGCLASDWSGCEQTFFLHTHLLSRCVAFAVKPLKPSLSLSLFT